MLRSTTSLSAAPSDLLIDIEDLPSEILAANPGLANADGTDDASDHGAFQAALDWADEQRAMGLAEEITIQLPAGTVTLDQTVTLSADDIRIEGQGADRTTIEGTWTAGPVEDAEVKADTLDASAHLLDLAEHDGLTIADATLTGADLHGAILGLDSDQLTLRGLTFDDFAWSAVRLFKVDDVVIEGNAFVDAGGRRDGDSGPTGGGIFGTYVTDAEVANNTFSKSADFDTNFYGVKGRQWRDSSIHHNTIETNFAIEFPFENDEGVDISYNVLDGVVSVPKYAGGPELDVGESFHVHHNYFTRSYSIEGLRNGLLVEKNAFVFDPEKDVGNLFGAFGGGNPKAPGPYVFQENLVVNPGRGIFWSDPGHDDVTIASNHVVANTTATPRTDGLVGLNSSKTDLTTLAIVDNVIEVYGQERGLVRNDASGELATIENNRLVGIDDTDRYANPQTGAPQGLTEALVFDVGAYGAFAVDSDALLADARPGGSEQPEPMPAPAPEAPVDEPEAPVAEPETPAPEDPSEDVRAFTFDADEPDRLVIEDFDIDGGGGERTYDTVAITFEGGIVNIRDEDDLLALMLELETDGMRRDDSDAVVAGADLMLRFDADTVLILKGVADDLSTAQLDAARVDYADILM